ncbi:MAG TPA: sigma-70 family RNA polymerase sigma factor [Puia sp.]|nr:sigma-70 family RNA polymerase sigma factor [Puia sp.]
MKDDSFNAEQFFQQFKSGDEEAFGKLVKRLYPILCGRVERHLGSTFSSADVVNGILLKVWNKRSTFKTLDGLTAYLLKATKNSSISQWRSELRRKKLYKKAQELSKDLPGESSPDIRHDKLKAIIRNPAIKLSDKNQAILIMRFLEDRSIDEIAAKMKLSEENVSTMQSRAIKILRAFFNGTKPPFCWLILAISSFF